MDDLCWKKVLAKTPAFIDGFLVEVVERGQARHLQFSRWLANCEITAVLAKDCLQPLVNKISIKTLENYGPSYILSYSSKLNALTRN